MATNEIFRPGYQIAVVVSHPATPVSGDPVRLGAITGIAQADEGEGQVAAATETSVDFGPGVWDMVVDDNEGTGIAIGDPIYYHDTATGSPATRLNNSATGENGFFGFALEAISANGTATIRVMHVAPGGQP